MSAENTKLMINTCNTNGIQREMEVKGHKLNTVTSFKYPGAVVADGGSKTEIFTRIE